MTPEQQFMLDREKCLRDYQEDKAFQDLSHEWLKTSMSKRYVYNFDWMGRPIIQYPQDIVGIQQLIWSVRPDLIIETGIAHGGSLVFSASMLAMLDICDAINSGEKFDPKKSSRKVIGIDIEIRPHNLKAILEHPMASRIEMIEGSSIDQKIIERVKEKTLGYKKIMVLLDSMHTHDHVIAELNAYGSMVSPDSYCVVFDTFVEDMPPQFFADRPWDIGNNPKTAVLEWLKGRPDFVVDRSIEARLMVTVAPNGFLKRML